MHVDCTNSILSIEWIQSHDLIDIRSYYYIVLSRLQVTLGNDFTQVNSLPISWASQEHSMPEQNTHQQLHD